MKYRLVDLASKDGHHVPGTPYKYRHGWIPRALESFAILTPDTASALLASRKADKPTARVPSDPWVAGHEEYMRTHIVGDAKSDPWVYAMETKKRRERDAKRGPFPVKPAKTPTNTVFANVPSGPLVRPKNEPMTSSSKHYNDVPERRGISRTKSTYGEAGTGRDREDAARLAAHKAQQKFPVIHKSDLSTTDARRSREVTPEEFQEIAKRGAAKYELTNHGVGRGTPKALYDRFSWRLKVRRAFDETRKPWGGVTFDAHTGKEVTHNADAYALTVRPVGMDSVTVKPDASGMEFLRAMNDAREKYKDILSRAGHHLGVFHDADKNIIDIDPVLIVYSLKDAEEIGAFTHATGGAYHFKSGDGFWPPHVKG